jgi:hypothetical protein
MIRPFVLLSLPLTMGAKSPGNDSIPAHYVHVLLKTGYGQVEQAFDPRKGRSKFIVSANTRICVGLNIPSESEKALDKGGEVVSGDNSNRLLYSISATVLQVIHDKRIPEIIDHAEQKNRVIALPDPYIYDICSTAPDTIFILTSVKVPVVGKGYVIETEVKQSQRFSRYRLTRPEHRPYFGNVYIPLESSLAPDGTPIFEVLRDVQALSATVTRSITAVPARRDSP